MLRHRQSTIHSGHAAFPSCRKLAHIVGNSESLASYTPQQPSADASEPQSGTGATLTPPETPQREVPPGSRYLVPERGARSVPEPIGVLPTARPVSTRTPARPCSCKIELLLSTSRLGWATAAAGHVKAIRRREARSSAASLHSRLVERLAAAARLRAAPSTVE